MAAAMTLPIFETRITKIPRAFQAPRKEVAVFGQRTVGRRNAADGVAGCEGGTWIELTQDRVQWWALVLAVLNLCVLLSES